MSIIPTTIHSGVQHILCYVFVLFVFLLCTLCCQFPWIVHFWVPLRYSLTFINTSEIERKLTLRLILLIDWFCRSLFFLLSAITPLASSNSFHCLMLSIYIHDENKCSHVYNLSGYIPHLYISREREYEHNSYHNTHACLVAVKIQCPGLQFLPHIYIDCIHCCTCSRHEYIYWALNNEKSLNMPKW
jgi:hypothetical protein